MLFSSYRAFMYFFERQQVGSHLVMSFLVITACLPVQQRRPRFLDGGDSRMSVLNVLTGYPGQV